MNGRGFLTWKIQDATMRMQSTPDPELKKHWARVMNEAKRARGDFEPVRQESGAALSGAIPVSASAETPTGPTPDPSRPQDVPSAACETAATLSAGCDAIAEAQRQIIQTPQRALEALRAAADRPGERHD